MHLLYCCLTTCLAVATPFLGLRLPFTMATVETGSPYSDKMKKDRTSNLAQGSAANRAAQPAALLSARLPQASGLALTASTKTDVTGASPARNIDQHDFWATRHGATHASRLNTHWSTPYLASSSVPAPFYNELPIPILCQPGERGLARSGSRASQRGLSVLESSIAVALVALLAAGVYAIAVPAKFSAEVQVETRNLQSLRNAVASAYSTRASYTGLSMASAITENWLPPDMRKDNRWGAISLDPTTSLATNDSWSVTYPSVPAPACSKLVLQQLRSSWTTIKVGAAVVGNQADATADCAAAPTSSVVFVQYGGARTYAGAEGTPLPPGEAPLPPTPPNYAPAPPPPPFAPAPPNESTPIYGAPVPGSGPCVLPSPASKQQQAACPFGQISSVAPYGAAGLLEQSDASCPAPIGDPSWSPWSIITNTCAPICTAPLPFANQPASQSAPCPNGQVTIASGSATFTQTAPVSSTTYACPAPTGDYVTTPGAINGPWTPTASTVCAPACVAPQPSSSPPVTRQTTCPSGQITVTGSTTFSQTSPVSNTIYNCAAPTGDYQTTPGTTTGGWLPDASSVCFPPCVAPPASPSNPPATLQTSCPPGQLTVSGGATSFTQTATVSGVSYTCPAPTGPYTPVLGTQGPWLPTIGDTCAPICVAPPQLNNPPIGSQPATCPPGSLTSGFSSSFTQGTSVSPTNYSCPGATGPYTTTPGTPGPWSPTAAQACSVTCSPPVGQPGGPTVTSRQICAYSKPFTTPVLLGCTSTTQLQEPASATSFSYSENMTWANQTYSSTATISTASATPSTPASQAMSGLPECTAVVATVTLGCTFGGGGPPPGGGTPMASVPAFQAQPQGMNPMFSSPGGCPSGWTHTVTGSLSE